VEHHLDSAALKKVTASSGAAPEEAAALTGTFLIAGLIIIVSYILVMWVGNQPLQIVESVFVAPASGIGPLPGVFPGRVLITSKAA